MRGAFDDEDLEPARPKHDAELTLGPFMLVSLFLGLIVICALCFGMGYAAGRRTTANTTTNLPRAAGPQLPMPVSASATKPSAVTQNQPQQIAATEPIPASGSDSNPFLNPVGVPASAPPPAQPQVHPVFPPPEQTPEPGTSPQVQPALPQKTSLMVQVAAVSQVEDARVLVNALRKRGFTVTAVREPSDGLIHVQVGPFTDRNQAAATSQKLLSDGYNAILVP
jgi:cell division septation protein DedD